MQTKIEDARLEHSTCQTTQDKIYAYQVRINISISNQQAEEEADGFIYAL